MNFAVDTFPAERLGLITGSRCACLFPKKSAEVGQRALAKELAMEKFFQYFDEFSNWQMEHGKLGEHFAHLHFEKFHDKDIQKGEWLRIGECGGSPDAVGATYGVDYKCPTSLEKWLDYLTEPLSSDQVNQCQMYMWLTKKDKWLIAAYLVETNLMSENGLVYPVPDADRMILVEVEKDPTWEERLSIAAPRVIAMRDQFIEMYALKFKRTP